MSPAGAFAAPTKADAKSVKPMASGAMLPWPGFVTAVAYTTMTSVKVMMAWCSGALSCAGFAVYRVQR